MTVDQEVDVMIGRERRARNFPETAAGVTRLVCATRLRAAHRQARGPVWMQVPKRADGQAVAQHTPERAIATILLRSQAVTMLHSGVPPRKLAGPRSFQKADSCLFEDVPAPAVVIACDHRDGHTRVAEVHQRRQRPHSAARHHTLPLEPELEQIAVDQQRSRMPGKRAQEAEQGTLHVVGRVAKMNIGDDEGGRWQLGHGSILYVRSPLYKRHALRQLRATAIQRLARSRCVQTPLALD